MSLTDPGGVARQYAHEANLEARSAVWRPGPDGRDPHDVVRDAVLAGVSGAPGSVGHVLEVGCGTGVLAAGLLAALPAGSTLVAVDTSERFVDLTAARGVPARVADVQRLPFDDATFDVVVAAWMLYHVPDLDRGLAEIARVLRPGGRLVAATNGDEHVADLRREAGGEAVVTHFSRENGAAALRRHFTDVTQDDLTTHAVFADREAALGYLESSQEDVSWDLPAGLFPRTYLGHVTVFTATGPR